MSRHEQLAESYLLSVFIGNDTEEKYPLEGRRGSQANKGASRGAVFDNHRSMLNDFSELQTQTNTDRSTLS